MNETTEKTTLQKLIQQWTSHLAPWNLSKMTDVPLSDHSGASEFYCWVKLQDKVTFYWQEVTPLRHWWLWNYCGRNKMQKAKLVLKILSANILMLKNLYSTNLCWNQQSPTTSFSLCIPTRRSCFPPLQSETFEPWVRQSSTVFEISSRPLTSHCRPHLQSIHTIIDPMTLLTFVHKSDILLVRNCEPLCRAQGLLCIWTAVMFLVEMVEHDLWGRTAREDTKR